jgi:hypothetical protein
MSFPGDPNTPAPVAPVVMEPEASPYESVGKSGVQREPGDVPQERKALVKRWCDDIKKARKFWKDDFDRMKSDEDMLLGLQWVGQTKLDDDRYIVNVCQRHIQQRTASIYAKNPTVVAKQKPMMDYKLWDENPLSFQMASQLVATSGQMAQAAQAGDPQAQAQMMQSQNNPQAMQAFAMAQALIKDVQEGSARKGMKARICKTMELYFKNKVLSQQNPPFKAQMKQLVRRTHATGIGYLKLGLVREMQERVMSPDELKGMATLTERMSQLETMMADMSDDDPAYDGCCGEKEEIRLMVEAMRARPQDVVQEGIVFDFPPATSIIPDWRMVHLQGFLGCQFVSEEYMLSVDDVQKVWKTDVGGNCTMYNPDTQVADTTYSGDNATGTGSDYKKGLACVWVTYDRTTGLIYTTCDGYPDFLEEPDAPPLVLERFFPWYALGFNYIEHHKQRFPLSDVFLMKPEQREMNRCREGLRQHRIANRPLTAVAAGMLNDDDIKKLEERPANGVVQLNALGPQAKIGDVLQTVQHPPLNPALYDVEPQFQDILRTVGTQEANLGGTSSATATESSIAESSRVSSLQSNMDDLDDFLTEVMRDAGKVTLMEISAEQISRVVGVGAVWPTLSNQDVADEIFLEIKAGSSGRPNKAQEIQNFQQLAPILMQIPGISPQWIAEQVVRRMDDDMDLTDAFVEGQPSIQTLNALAAKPLPDAPLNPGAQDANAQGPEGANNAPQASGTGGGLGPQGQNRSAPAAPPVMN